VVVKKDSKVVIKRERVHNGGFNLVKLKMSKEDPSPVSKNDHVGNTSGEESSGDSTPDNDYNEFDLDAELQNLDYDNNNNTEAKVDKGKM
jgi:hypothetical protein